MSYPDILVACTESGLVMLLEKVVDPATFDARVQVYTDGQKVLIDGFPCPGCRIRFELVPYQEPGLPAGMTPRAVSVPEVRATQKPSCKYRPLRGPLFVP